MNYQQHYDRLITRARERQATGYTERHHIVPKCCGGSNDPSNLVRLTPEEHYVAHQLLVKCYPGNEKLLNAAIMMRANRPGNKVYAWLRRKWSQLQAKRQQGSANSQYGTRWIHSPAAEQSRRIAADDELPAGWVEGRKINFSTSTCLICKREKVTKNVCCSRSCHLELLRQQNAALARQLYEDFLASEFESIVEYARAINSSQPRLTQMWRRHIPEYSSMSHHGMRFKHHKKNAN